MTLNDLFVRLASTGFPVAENQFKTEERPAPPFLTYRTVGHRPMYADGAVYWFSGQVRIDLYTTEKDPEAEAKIRQALTGLSYTWTEQINNDQAVYNVTITMEV